MVPGPGDGLTAAVEDVQAVRKLGSRYALERVLGTGAMGEVWLAVDTGTGEQVAAKLLRREYARDPAILGRFVQERSILVDLHHPNVVRVRDLVVEGEDLAIVMDLVEGSDLRGQLGAHGTLRPEEAVRIAVDVLGALGEAHSRGILHRDVKPDNVLMDGTQSPPRVLLSDFSIARLAQETTVRMTGVLGTAEYIAPEVFTAEQVSAAADVYGTGVLLYELLAGRTPFAGGPQGGGGGGFAIANRHVNALPPEVPGLPEALWPALQAMLQKDPRRRPTAAAAARALQEAAPSLAGLAPLPVQAAPVAWQTVADTVPAAELGVLGHRPSADAPLDPGQTNVRAAPNPLAAPAPLPASEAGWAGPQAQVDEQVLGAQTQLRAPAAPRPVEAPVEREPETAPRPALKNPRVLAAAASTAVLLVLAAVLLPGRGGDDPAPAPQAQAPAQAVAPGARAPVERAPSGLSTLREATYDAQEGTLTTTVTWTAGENGLAGPFFEPVPAAGQDDVCPDVVWDVPALREAAAGVAPQACGWKVSVGDLGPDQEVVATYTTAWAPPADADVEAAVRTRLQEQSEAGASALASFGDSPDYPAQRLADLAVQISGETRVGAPIDLLVLPVWAGQDEPSQVDVVFSSRSPSANELLRQLGGELDVTTEDCSSSIAFSDGAPYANTPGRSCTITARLGSLSRASRTFDIGQNSVS